MNMMKWLILLCACFAALIPGKRALHMFQQNRYETGRYVSWIKENVSFDPVKYIHIALLLLAGIVLLFLKGSLHNILIILILIAAGVIYILKEQKKEQIKPLVFTGRVKRQIAVMTVLYLIVMVLLVRFTDRSFVPLCAALLPWILIWPMAWITSPIEAAVRQKYLNEAKKILESRPDLIKIGITGSYGKTSTKNIMQAMISEQYMSLMTPASYNTPMGITRTIREMLKPIHQVFVCEMGADHVGDIKELMEFVHPTIGVVTSIGPQHLQTFGSQQNIINEKMQEIEMLPKDGFGILNYDNEFIRNYKVKNTVDTVTYGIRSEDADYRAVDITYTQNGSSFTVVHGDERIPMETKLLGELNILNILSAVAAARRLNVGWNVIRRAVRTMRQVEHRLELKVINGHRFIDDAFNANPSGSAMALDVLGMMPGTRFIVTPGMIDLGEKQYEINKNFGRLMKNKADVVILVGEVQTKPIREGLEEAGFDRKNVHVVKTVKEAFAIVYRDASASDTILLENDLPDAFSH